MSWILLCVAALWGSFSVIHGQASSSNATLRFVSFNTFLTGPRATTRALNGRLAELQRLLNASNSPLQQADAICLQEVQAENDLKAVQDNARVGGFPYSYSFVDARSVSPAALASGAGPACNALSLLTIQPCLTVQCASAGTDVRLLVSCVMSKCKSQVLAASISQECVNCLTNLGFAGLTRCPSEKLSDHRTTFGLLLLSKHPLVNAKARKFELPLPSIYSRGYIEAEVC